MSLSLDDFYFGDDNISVQELHNYVRQIDPYFDLRKLQSFFNNNAYRDKGFYYGVSIRPNIEKATSAGILIRLPGHTARADQVNAVAQARGVKLVLKDDIEGYAINWRSVLYAGVIKRGLIHSGHGINKPLSAYDLCWWISRWGSEPVTEGEVIAAMDAPTVRCKLNWDMGIGIGWDGFRMLNVGDLSWYRGPFADMIAQNDGKAPPPPGEQYGYGFISIDDARRARERL